MEFGFQMRFHNQDSHSIPKSIRSPTVFGDFSLDNHRKFFHDRRNLKFVKLHDEEVYLDLNEAMNKVQRKNYEETKKERLDRLLDWILLNQYKFSIDKNNIKNVSSLSTDFVCFRGLLTELLCTPYESREGWIIHASKFRGTIYLLGVETPEKIERRTSETERDRQMSSWGYKFEQYMTGGDPKEGVDENEEYCSVLRTRLGSHSLLYGAEVDAAEESLYAHPHASLAAFVEFKTCRQLETANQRRNFYRFRMRKWWAQSYLVGIPSVLCGFRDDAGIVHNLKSFKVDEMPILSKEFWSKDVMLNYLDDFLMWLKSVVKVDDPSFVYEVYRSPSQPVVICNPLGGQSKHQFLPEHYVKQICT